MAEGRGSSRGRFSEQEALWVEGAADGQEASSAQERGAFLGRSWVSVKRMGHTLLQKTSELPPHHSL